MTKKSSKGKRTTKQSKRLSVSKKTLRDLSIRGQGPAGGRKADMSDICPPKSDNCKFSQAC